MIEWALAAATAEKPEEHRQSRQRGQYPWYPETGPNAVGGRRLLRLQRLQSGCRRRLRRRRALGGLGQGIGAWRWARISRGFRLRWRVFLLVNEMTEPI